MQDLPQVLLYKVQFLRDTLLKPALINADLKIISGLACLMSEIGQAVSTSSILSPYECAFNVLILFFTLLFVAFCGAHVGLQYVPGTMLDC